MNTENNNPIKQYTKVEELPDNIKAQFQLKREFNMLMSLAYPDVKADSVQYKIMERTWWAAHLIMMNNFKFLSCEVVSDELSQELLKHMFTEVDHYSELMYRENLARAKKLGIKLEA